MYLKLYRSLQKMPVNICNDWAHILTGPTVTNQMIKSQTVGKSTYFVTIISLQSHHKRTYEVIVAMAHRMEALDDPDL